MVAKRVCGKTGMLASTAARAVAFLRTWVNARAMTIQQLQGASEQERRGRRGDNHNDN